MAKSALKDPDILIPLVLLCAGVVVLFIYIRALNRQMSSSIGKNDDTSGKKGITVGDKTYTFLSDDELKNLTTINV